MIRFFIILLAMNLVSCKNKENPSPSQRNTRKQSRKKKTSKFIFSEDYKGNRRIRSFNRAKKMLYTKVFSKKWRKTFYCGCSYEKDGRKMSIDFSSCGFKPRKNAKRASRIEAEHIVPASSFCQGWKFNAKNPLCRGKNCRKCSHKYDKYFSYMESDLYNLVPTVGEINGDRSNYSPDQIPGEKRIYGRCDFELDRKRKIFEPKISIRGDIARVYLYMKSTYPERISFSRSFEKKLQEWDRQDPVTRKECSWARRIEAIQGNENTILKRACAS